MKIGTTELLIILAVVVIVFGPTSLPVIMRILATNL